MKDFIEYVWKFLNFDFVNEYLIYNYIEKSNIEETLKEFADSNCDKLSEDDPFNLLNELCTFYKISSLPTKTIFQDYLIWQLY